MQLYPIEWYDTFTDTNERKIYTENEHKVPGLRMIGYHNTSRATASLNLHYHKDCFEFHYLVQGNLRFSVGNCSYSLSGGDLFITFPNQIHDTGDVPMSPNELYWMQVEANDIRRFLYMEPGSAAYVLEQLHQIQNHVVKMENSTAGILKEIFANISAGTELGRIQAGQMLGYFLCQIIKNASLPSFKITPDIGRTTEYIIEHIDEEISMEELAQVALLSVSRFKQKFKDQMGTSPRNFINYNKIEAAKHKLQENGNVTQTAMELGFSSSNYFSSVFRRFTSTSPTDYLKQLSDDRNSIPEVTVPEKTQ